MTEPAARVAVHVLLGLALGCAHLLAGDLLLAALRPDGFTADAALDAARTPWTPGRLGFVLVVAAVYVSARTRSRGAA